MARIRIPAAVSGTSYTAGENLLLGHVLTFDSAGDAVRASAVFASGIWEAIAVATAAALSAASVGVATSGEDAQVLFALAPAAAANGSRVFLSNTPGLAQLTVPTGGGRVVMVLGLLQGADGISLTPNIKFQPQYMSRRP